MELQSLTGLVTGPNLLSYIDTLSLQDYNDIADCNNIATRSADLGYHRYGNAEGWFEEYARTLNYLGGHCTAIRSIPPRDTSSRAPWRTSWWKVPTRYATLGKPTR
jgi:hypothetical protein